MNTLDLVGNSLIDNYSAFIENDPNYSFTVRVIYPYSSTTIQREKELVKEKSQSVNMFGYEPIKENLYGYEKRIENPITKITKSMILFKPERRFLKKVGILFDTENSAGGELPILSFFKVEDNVIRDSKIEIVITNYKGEFDNENIQIERTLEVVDIKTAGFGGTAKFIHILAPIR